MEAGLDGVHGHRIADRIEESVGKHGIEHHCTSVLRRKNRNSLVVGVSHLVSS